MGAIDLDRSWPEDESHENGRYQHRCYACDNLFMGHKRRVVCRLCSTIKENTRATTPPVVSSDPGVGDDVTYAFIYSYTQLGVLQDGRMLVAINSCRAVPVGEGELGPHDSQEPQVERLRLWPTDPSPEG